MSFENYPIQPKDINSKQHFWDAFGNCETEISAMWIVRFCQEQGGWQPFTFEALNQFYLKHFKDQNISAFTFNRLLGGEFTVWQRAEPVSKPFPAYVEQLPDGQYQVTAEFILNCYKSSPATTEEKVV